MASIQSDPVIELHHFVKISFKKELNESLEKLFVVAGQIEIENGGTGRQPTGLCDRHIPSIPSPHDPSTDPFR